MSETECCMIGRNDIKMCVPGIYDRIPARWSAWELRMDLAREIVYGKDFPFYQKEEQQQSISHSKPGPGKLNNNEGKIRGVVCNSVDKTWAFLYMGLSWFCFFSSFQAKFELIIINNIVYVLEILMVYVNFIVHNPLHLNVVFRTKSQTIQNLKAWIWIPVGTCCTHSMKIKMTNEWIVWPQVLG